MNKNFKSYAIIWALMVALFNVVTFVSPIEASGGAFWTGYTLITLAFLGQLAVSYLAFNVENVQKFFYKLPLITISWTGLILTLVFGGLCMVVSIIPTWISIILCILVLGFNAIALVKAKMAADLVEATEEKVKTKTLFIRSLTVDAEGLLARAKSDAVKAECKKVYEAIRYSDPMSNEGLASIEYTITGKFSDLSTAVAEDDEQAVAEKAREIVILIGDRNKKCRLLK